MAEKSTGSMLNRAAWVPEQSRNLFREWIDTNRKGCETFQDAVENGCTNLEKFFEKA